MWIPDGGTVIAVLAERDDGKLVVRFFCDKCSQVHESRWLNVRRGKGRTCERGRRFREHNTARAEGIDDASRKAIFETAVNRGANAAAKQFGISKALADFARRLHVEKLMALPLETRERISKLAAADDYELDYVASLFSLSIPEVRTIIARTPIAAESAVEMVPEPTEPAVPSELASRIEAALAALQYADECRKLPWGTKWDWRHDGEFSQRELGTGGDGGGIFGHLYEQLKTGEVEIPENLKGAAYHFLSVADATFAGRNERRAKYLKGVRKERLEKFDRALNRTSAKLDRRDAKMAAAA